MAGPHRLTRRESPEGDEDDRRRAFLSRFPHLEGRRYLLFLGRIDRKKGCDLLIAAFVRAAASIPSSTWSWRVLMKKIGAPSSSFR